MKAQIENNFARNRDEIDTQYQEELNKLESERSEAHAANRKARDDAFAEAGLNEIGDEPQAERTPPEYFTRHRNLTPVEADESEDSATETPDEDPGPPESKSGDEPSGETSGGSIEPTPEEPADQTPDDSGDSQDGPTPSQYGQFQ